MTFQKILFYLWIALLPTQLGHHWWLQESLVKGIRVDYLTVVIYVSEMVMVGVALLDWLFGQLRINQLRITNENAEDKGQNVEKRYLSNKATKQSSNKEKQFNNLTMEQLSNETMKQWNFTGYWLLATGHLLLQLFWVQFPIIHLVFIVKLILCGLFFTAVKNINYSRVVVKRIFIVQLWALLILGVMQMYHQGSLQGIWYWLGERRFDMTTPGIALIEIGGRVWQGPYGTFSHPNVMAGYALVVGMWMFLINNEKLRINQLRITNYELRIKENQKSKVKSHNKNTEFRIQNSEKKQWNNGTMKQWNFTGYWLQAPVFCLLIIISWSQAAWLVGLVVVTMYLGWNRGMKKLVWRVVGMGMLAPWILILVGKYMGGESLAMRNLLFSQYLKLGWWQYVLGLGWHGFLGMLAQAKGLVVYQPTLQPIHHGVWYLLSCFGIGVIWLVWKTRKQLVAIGKQRRWGLIFLSIFLLSCFDHYFVTSIQGQLLLLFVIIDWNRNI